MSPLCAYMIVGHPNEVFNQRGEHDDSLAEAAANLIREFELLIKMIVDGPKEFMANMLEKSLRPGNPVFERVSSAVQVATRGVVFGGSGVQGKEYAKTALQRVRAAVLTEKLIKTAEVLVEVATVSQNVHGPWYSEMIKNV